MLMCNVYALILAGGGGTRLFPLSTVDRPKQFIDLTGSGKSLLQETCERALGFALPQNIHISVSQRHRRHTLVQMLGYPPEISSNIVYEDMALNTAYPIQQGIRKIRDENAIVVVMPSDHYIGEGFAEAVFEAHKVAEGGKIVCFGIRPDSPNTNYGYLLHNRFHEKPTQDSANNLFSRGALWNSGIFVFKASVMREEYNKYCPKISAPISFDKAIMEKTDKINVIEADFEWADLGSFEMLDKFSANKKVISG